jgi:hypothetical protein
MDLQLLFQAIVLITLFQAPFTIQTEIYVLMRYAPLLVAMNGIPTTPHPSIFQVAHQLLGDEVFILVIILAIMAIF